jgi:hypothetical protein
MTDPDYPDDLRLTEGEWDMVDAWNEFLAFAELNEQEPVDG